MTNKDIPERWEERFQEHLAALEDWMPSEPLEIESSPVSYFGYKHYDGNSVWEVVDWGNIKSFIKETLATERAKTKLEDVEILYRHFMGTRDSAIMDVLEAAQKEVLDSLQPVERPVT